MIKVYVGTKRTVRTLTTVGLVGFMKKVKIKEKWAVRQEGEYSRQRGKLVQRPYGKYIWGIRELLWL